MSAAEGTHEEVSIEVKSTQQPLGIVCEAHQTLLPIQQQKLTWDTDQQRVTLEVIRVLPGGLVEEHNQRNPLTKVRPKD